MSNGNGSYPATPYIEQYFNRDTGVWEPNIQHEGLTKREHFAAIALQGVLANTTQTLGEGHEETEAAIAFVSVRLSDALLAALEGESS